MKMSKLEQMHAQMLARKLEKQKGATLIEYALVAAGVAVVAGVFFSTSTTDGIGKIIQQILDKAAAKVAA